MKLAIHGGDPVRRTPFPAHVTVGEEEKEAVSRVIDSGILSNFLGTRHENFRGGREVRALEEEWARAFGVKHAVAVNSCTSGLYCAVGATGVEPGEEIIVTPYTMSATAMAPLVYNAIPVFADIEEETFCLDADAVEASVTSRTRAIVVVDLFGLPYDAERINALAEKHGLFVIEDCAQAPGARYKGRCAGTLGHLGVYSLNYHKHIHCGEGGVVVTDSDALAEKVRLIRNHAEAVVEGRGRGDLANMIGFNFRMTELEAAVARCQLKKLDPLLAARQENVLYLEKRLADSVGIALPKVRDRCSHAYYLHALKFDEAAAGISRESFVEALRAELPPFALREKEGVKVGCGYVKPVYLLPLFQERIAYGAKGYPFEAGRGRYEKGACPVAERMYEQKLVTHEFMVPSMGRQDLDDVLKAFEKVWELRGSIKHG